MEQWMMVGGAGAAVVLVVLFAVWRAKRAGKRTPSILG